MGAVVHPRSRSDAEKPRHDPPGRAFRNPLRGPLWRAKQGGLPRSRDGRRRAPTPHARDGQRMDTDVRTQRAGARSTAGSAPWAGAFGT